MIRFLDGPAAGVSMQLRRAPTFLRVTCHFAPGGWDALDLLTDAPRPDETLYVYALATQRLESRGMIDYTGPQGQRQGRPFHALTAHYRLHAQQPPDEVLRDRVRWQTWCLAQPRPALAEPPPELDELASLEAAAAPPPGEVRRVSRRIIAERLASMLAGLGLAARRQHVQAAYPFPFPVGSRLGRVWSDELVRQAGEQFAPGGMFAPDQVVAYLDDVYCDWCRHGSKRRPKGCMACQAARTEYAQGALGLLIGFPLDMPAPIVADAVAEKGFETVGKLLRRNPGDFASA